MTDEIKGEKALVVFLVFVRVRIMELATLSTPMSEEREAERDREQAIYLIFTSRTLGQVRPSYGWRLSIQLKKIADEKVPECHNVLHAFFHLILRRTEI